MSANMIENLVIIASSTGGPKALHKLIPNLSNRLNAPVVIVQHMPSGFTASLAERLGAISEIEVSEAVDGETLKRGHVYIAKGGTHLTLVRDNKNRVVIQEDLSEPVSGLRPCADITFKSIASLNVRNVVCVVLTGMGSDGCEGICQLRKNQNIYTIAQHKDSCIVYGMPKAIVEAGIADCILPLENISTEIIKKVGVY